jgi:hypothetical protein
MAYQHAPLTEQEQGPGVLKVAGPDAPKAMRAMAARGLAPIPPRDLIVALYQFWVVNEPVLAEEAAKTIEGLPVGVLVGALGDPALHPGVLDFLGRKLVRKDEVLELVVRHANVSNETLAGVARVCPEPICNILAENQQRWLRFPAIVESLYQNPNCRMSVAQHMIELAVRQGVTLHLPNIDEIKAALGDGAAVTAEEDARFTAILGKKVGDAHAKVVERVQRLGVREVIDYDAAAAAAEEDFDVEAFLAATPDDELSLPLDGKEAPQVTDDARPTDRITATAKLPAALKVRLALLGDAFDRSILIRDTNKVVALAAIKSPRVKENEVIAYAANRTLSLEVVRYIAKRREWIKLYQVKYNLVLNPKTSMNDAMSLLGHLYPHDVRKVARSKNIPSALAQAAKRKEGQRR